MTELNKPRLLQDFLLPHLERQTFRDKLRWVDRSQGKFMIFWRHQSSSKFSPDEDSCVFEAWAVAKNRWDPRDPKCRTIAKQRVRAALLKLKTVRCIDRTNESRIYQIVSKDEDQPAARSDEDSSESSAESFEECLPFQFSDDFLESDYFIEQLLRTPVFKLS